MHTPSCRTAPVFLLGDVTRNTTAGATEGELGAPGRYVQRSSRPELHAATGTNVTCGRRRLRATEHAGQAQFGPTERRGILELTGRIPMPQDVWLFNAAGGPARHRRRVLAALSLPARDRAGVQRKRVVMCPTPRPRSTTTRLRQLEPPALPAGAKSNSRNTGASNPTLRPERQPSSSATWTAWASCSSITLT